MVRAPPKPPPGTSPRTPELGVRVSRAASSIGNTLVETPGRPQRSRVVQERFVQVEYSSYNTRKVFGPIWRWQANIKGERQKGYSLGCSSARRAARSAIRDRRELPDSTEPRA
jgi:hypothetical protein